VAFDLLFGDYHVLLFLLSCGVAAGYVLTKNWLLSNLYGEIFSMTAIQLLRLDSFYTGMILLSGLFFYDIFWVFG
jgi:minor histocompatibility antigen H13